MKLRTAIWAGVAALALAASGLAQQARQPASEPSGSPLMFLSEGRLCVLRGDTLYLYDADSMRLLETRRIPDGDTAGQHSPGAAPHLPQRGEVTVEMRGSRYRGATAKPTGWFATGQEADILLSGIGFNDTGGPLLFNHPGGIASDGARLLLADRNNNRVLVWNRIPTANVPPDLVLGQGSFTTNNPGRGMHEMNWPVSVTAAEGKVVVADTYNDRILIWSSFPTRSAQPADLAIHGLHWPWGVWTDGRKLVASVTRARRILIWNSFPTMNDQAPDLVLTGQGRLGTPRTVTCNGRSLIVGDHNANTDRGPQGCFVWKTFPTRQDEPYDYFMTDPLHPGSAWPQGDFTSDGRLLLLSWTLHLWDAVPRHESESPRVSIEGYRFNGGDGSDVAVTPDGRVYISASNSNKILAYDAIPSRSDALPSFAIGSPDIHTNTLETHCIISNPVPASDGKSLFVSSDFDRKLYVWRELPDESGAMPDAVYSLPDGPWDNAMHGQTLALAGRQTVTLWKNLPLQGELPDVTLSGGIGSVRFQELRGVALDDKYFYLADSRAGKIYVWEGIPSPVSEPRFVLPANRPSRLSSDGDYLAICPLEGHAITIYRVSEFGFQGRPFFVGGVGKFNLPESALAAGGHLFVADTCFNRVHCWRSIEDALRGSTADVVLGARDLADVVPEIGRDTLFWPGSLAFDGSYLWVGEFKFSERLLRFSVRPTIEP